MASLYASRFGASTMAISHPVGAFRPMRTRIALLVQPEFMRSIVGATQAGFGVELAVRLLPRTFTHETISSSIKPLLLLIDANY